MRQAVLIVENDLPTLELYQRALSRDYQVFTCRAAQDVLLLLQKQPVAALVLEPYPQNEQAWSLLSTLKHSPGLASIKVILCSILDERQRGLALGVAAYLVKPVLPANLLETLRQILRQD